MVCQPLSRQCPASRRPEHTVQGMPRIVQSTPAQPFFQPIFDLCSPRLTFGHTVLLGNAAFVARPHCGMGVTKAVGDWIEVHPV